MSHPQPEPVASKVINQAVEGLTDMADYLRLDPVPPIWRQIRRYTLDVFRADALAGLMLAIVTIPQAVAFAFVVGIPVQAVITAAIIGAFFFSLWSTSKHVVFGPTNTVSIILAGALVATASIPLNPLQKVVLIGFMMGVVQLACGFFKLGNLTHFISRTVIIAYSTAAGILIGVGQLPNFLGLGRAADISLPGVIQHVIRSLAHFQANWIAVGIGAVTLGALLLMRRWKSGWPDGLIVLGLIGALAAGFERFHASLGFPAGMSLSGLGVTLIGDVGEIAGSLPLFQGFPVESAIQFIPQVASIALAAAMLGMLETISIANSLAARSGQKINPNQELMAAGLGNLFCSAFGAMAGSASFLRSNVALESKGRTQLGPILGSVFIMAIVIVGASLVNFIPVTALAAYIILLAFRLARSPEGPIVRRATRSDALAYWATLVATLFLRLDTAIYLGMGLSLVLFLRKASAPSLVEYSFNEQGQLSHLEDKASRTNAAISIVHVEGELFFGAAELFQEQVRYLADDENLRVVVLRMKNARHLDATSVLALLQLKDYLSNSGRHLLISGINPDMDAILHRSGALARLGSENIFPAEANLTMSTKRALKRANQLLQIAKGSKAELRIAYNKPRALELEASMKSSVKASEVFDFEI